MTWLLPAVSLLVVGRPPEVVHDTDGLGSGCVLCHEPDFLRGAFGDRTIMICDTCEREFHCGLPAGTGHGRPEGGAGRGWGEGSSSLMAGMACARRPVGLVPGNVWWACALCKGTCGGHAPVQGNVWRACALCKGTCGGHAPCARERVAGMRLVQGNVWRACALCKETCGGHAPCARKRVACMRLVQGNVWPACALCNDGGLPQIWPCTSACCCVSSKC